jgi:hypothetical protein
VIRGNCYYASEALYHILGGKAAGWTPQRMKYRGDTHWWLKHTSGLILDPSQNQFDVLPDYSKGRGAGFQTKRPSKAAFALMTRLTWQCEKGI